MLQTHNNNSKSKIIQQAVDLELISFRGKYLYLMTIKFNMQLLVPKGHLQDIKIPLKIKD